MPMLGCNVETAVAIVANEQEQVFAAGLDQHLLQCRPRARVCKCAIVGVYVFVCMRGVGAYVCTCVCVRGTLRSYCIMSVNSRVSVCGCVNVRVCVRVRVRARVHIRVCARELEFTCA